MVFPVDSPDPGTRAPQEATNAGCVTRRLTHRHIVEFRRPHITPRIPSASWILAPHLGSQASSRNPTATSEADVISLDGRAGPAEPVTSASGQLQSFCRLNLPSRGPADYRMLLILVL